MARGNPFPHPVIKTQRYPRGLLGLLGIVGDSPPGVLEAEFKATIETIDLILAQVPSTTTSVNNAAAVTGTLVNVDVPEGQIWFVEGIEARVLGVIPAVSNRVVVSSNWYGMLSNVPFIVGSTIPPVPVANRSDVANYRPERALFAGPGSRFSASILATDAAGVQNLWCTVTHRIIST